MLRCNARLKTVSTLRAAVVGAGSFGKNHLRVVHNSPNAELAGVFDTNSARAAEIAAPYSCPVFSSLEELAANADAAIIATPTVSHSEIGCLLMERGLDVMVEKPISNTLEGARALVETAAAWKNSASRASGAL